MDYISIFYINIECIFNKTNQLLLFLEEHDLSIVCFSGHWLSHNIIQSMNLDTYNLVSIFCRTTTIYGGVSIYVKPNINCRAFDLNIFNKQTDTEFYGIEMPLTKTIVIIVYRFCLGKFSIFLGKLEELLNFLTEGKLINKVILLGDFNQNFESQSPELLDLVCLTSSFRMFLIISDYTRVIPGCRPSCINQYI